MRRSLSLVAFLFFLLPIAFVYAAGLININTADAELLDTLPGIGPTKAQAIIDYRTEHGSFARIEDIQNVSGIGESTYADIKSLITVGDVVPAPETASSTPSVSTFSGSASIYTPPPSMLSLQISGAGTALLEVPLRLSARATTKGGTVDSAAQIRWSFGDGSSAEGSVVEKTYHYAGMYLVVATAIDGDTRAQAEITVTVSSVKARLLPVSGSGITVMNDAPERLDLSRWWLRSDTGSFRIPEGTVILPASGVLFPFSITNLPFSQTAMLLYPDGVVTASVAPVALVQPLAEAVSYKQVQSVEPIISTRKIVPSYEEAVLAPAATTELAAAGAPLSFALATTEPAAKSRAPGIFSSPWTFGLLGVIALAGTAFILL